MRIKTVLILAIYALILQQVVLLNSCNPTRAGELDQNIYLDTSLSANERIGHLLNLMTLDEKVGQMCQFVGLEHMKAAEQDMTKEELAASDARGFYPGLHSSEVEEMVRDGLIGSFLHVVDPAEAEYLQQLARESRLKIPLLVGIDAIHGTGLVQGATIYPSPIGMAATWDTGLVRLIAEQTAVEMLATGSVWTFAPNIDIARDPRWGRVGETFGEDPLLVSEMGRSMIRGLQGTDPDKLKVAACAKHLIGGGESVNGLNGAPTDISERTLREIHLPPYRIAIEEGVATIMTAHNELNGIPCHADEWMMKELIREEMGFDGFYVSDWMDIERLASRHFIAGNNDEAVYETLKAGMDMHMHGPGFHESVLALLKEGKIDIERIDESVRRILEIKFKLGLFDQSPEIVKPGVDTLFNKEHLRTALEAARKSVVLLENKSKLLPLEKSKSRKIFISGPNADNQTILGDWVNKQPDGNVVTVREGIRAVFESSEIDFLDVGDNPMDLGTNDIEIAARRASEADIAIIVAGDNSFRWEWNDKTNGENAARADVGLAGKQDELIKAVSETGTPTIVVIVGGRPLSVDWIGSEVDALLYAWEPGSSGGQAIAEVISGDVNPSGKLPVTLPLSSGHILSVYNHKPTNYFHSYRINETRPVYSFGFGLSYTEFLYSNLKVKKTRDGRELIRVSVEVRNTGRRKGDEIVQLYLRDNVSSVTRPVKELKGFRRISLEPGESQRVIFDLDTNMLRFYDRDMKMILEEGWFTVFVGSSSEDKALISVPFEI